MAEYIFVGLPLMPRTSGSVPVRPTIRNTLNKGIGYLAGEFPGGITTVEGVPVAATVRIIYRPASGETGDGSVVAEVQSAPDGSWLVAGLNPKLRYDVIGRLDGFNDVIASNVKPVDILAIDYRNFLSFSDLSNEVGGYIEVYGGIPPYTASVIDVFPAGLSASISDKKLIVAGESGQEGFFTPSVLIAASNGVERVISIPLPIGSYAQNNMTATSTLESAPDFKSVQGSISFAGGVPPYSAQVLGSLPAGFYVEVDGLEVSIEGSTAEESYSNPTIKITASNGASVEVPVVIVANFYRPGRLKASYEELTGITLTWGSSRATQSISIYRSETPFDMAALPSPIAVIGGDVETYSDASVTVGTSYYYMVMAECNGVHRESKVVSAVAKTGYRYWRINATAGNSHISIGELEFSESVGGTNGCVGGEAISNGDWPTLLKEYAFDGSFTDPSWAAAVGTAGWLGYRFTAPMAIREARISARSGSNQSPRDFTVEYSEDGTLWQVAASFTNVTSWPSYALKSFTW